MTKGMIGDFTRVSGPPSLLANASCPWNALAAPQPAVHVVCAQDGRKLFVATDLVEKFGEKLGSGPLQRLGSLTGILARASGVWQASLWSHNMYAKDSLERGKLSRAMLLYLGRLRSLVGKFRCTVCLWHTHSPVLVCAMLQASSWRAPPTATRCAIGSAPCWWAATT